MKRFTLSAVVVAAAMAALPVAGQAAGGDDDVGSCGWGSKVWEGQGGLAAKVLAVTTNGTSGNQTFAITSGTKDLQSLSNFTIQPNPTRSTAEVRISLNQPESLQMQVYGMDGALLESRILGDFTSGSHVIALDAARYASGSYRVVLQGKGGVAQTQWMVVK